MPDGVPPPRTVASRLTTILLTFRAGSNHSLTEMAGITGLPMSTVHRMAAELAAWQLLTRLPDGRYVIGPNLRHIAGAIEHRPRLEERAALVVADLADVTQRRARMGVLEAGSVPYLEKVPGADPVSRCWALAPLPAHATALGKALLAFSTRPVLAPVGQRLASYTPRTITSSEQLQRHLQIVRVTRLAQSYGELVVDECAIAAPVFGPGGVAVAALEIQVRDLRDDADRFRAPLEVAARGLSRELALSGPADDVPDRRSLAAPGDGVAGPPRPVTALRPGRGPSRHRSANGRYDSAPSAVKGGTRGT